MEMVPLNRADAKAIGEVLVMPGGDYCTLSRNAQQNNNFWRELQESSEQK